MRADYRRALITRWQFLAGKPFRVMDNLMRRKVPILIVILLAMLGTPLQLPAASCILFNGPNPDGCKPHCCANKSCCALSQKNKRPAQHPLVDDSSVKQPVFGLTTV